ncbi:hypothetical protein STEG23_001564 [Scotinomys teguina]
MAPGLRGLQDRYARWSLVVLDNTEVVITESKGLLAYDLMSLKNDEDENLWIASRLIWFDQPRPPDSSQTAPVKIGPSS